MHRKTFENFALPRQFPHEIGLFLGYPPEDVCGYIRNKGKCQKCTGHWQVYGDENFALAKDLKGLIDVLEYFAKWQPWDYP